MPARVGEGHLTESYGREAVRLAAPMHVSVDLGELALRPHGRIEGSPGFLGQEAYAPSR